MTPKEYLSQYGRIERNICRMEEEKEHCRQRALRITPNYEPTISGAGGASDRVGQAVEKMARWEEKIVAEIDRLCDLREEIETVIGAVPDPVQRELLERRYIQLQSLERIAVEMNYSYERVRHLHGYALAKVIVPEKATHHDT